MGKIVTHVGFRQIWVLDAQWSDCPEEVKDEVRNLWGDFELGNDDYIIKMTLDELAEHDCPAITEYVQKMNPALGQNETFWIHWWW